MRIAAHSAAASTPTLASASSGPVKASEAMSSETVNPMPAMVPAPMIEAQPAGGRRRPLLSQVTRNVVPEMPSGLPSTYPARMPRVTGEVNAWARNGPLIWTPALASANSGTMT